MDRVLLTELKEFLTERMVDNMSTKDLEEYVSNDLFNYFDKLGEPLLSKSPFQVLQLCQLEFLLEQQPL